MTASLIPISTGSPMIFTKDEATAAQRTWVFYLSNTADGSPATGKTIAGSDFQISKAGGGFGNAVGTVTELTLGWYKMVFDAGDLDTIGALGCELAIEAGVDPLRVTHQVAVLDLNTATVNPAASGITATTIATDAIGAAEVAADAVSKIQAGLATSAAVDALANVTKTVVKDLGVLSTDGHLNVAGAYCGISILDAMDATVTLGGAFDGSTVTIETCEDPAATTPVWTTYDDSAGSNENPATAGAVIVVLAPHVAIRAVMSDDGAASAVTVSVAIRKAAGV